MDLGWGTVVQAVILAVCTWYVRRGSKADAATVVRGTAAQSTSNEIRDEVVKLKAQVEELSTDVRLVKRATVGVDDRGPRLQS